jgi:hypothetical protein
MRVNINDIILGDLMTSELINNLKNNDNNDEIYINIDIDITEQDLKDFNERVINPSNINSIINLCNFLSINCKEITHFIINNIKPGNEIYILNDINKSKYIDLLFLENKTINNILKYDLIEWLKFKFNECDKQILCAMCTYEGAIKCLKYAHENGCLWDEDICSFAAGNGQLECLKYLHENGCPWDNFTCSYAAENGQLKCLKYAHENGCPWDEWTCLYASINDQLECLKYAHENGCPWNKRICNYAAKYGYLECLKYAHENGCPWDIWTYLYASKYQRPVCLKYLQENGCPQNTFFEYILKMLI